MKADAGIQERIGHLAATLADESGYVCYLHSDHDRSIILVATLLGESGYVCYRSFAATPSYLERNPDTAQRFVSGHGKAQRWVAESATAAVADCIAGVFPDYSRDVLTESVRRYQAAGVWAAGPRISRQGYARMRAALMDITANAKKRYGLRPDARRPHSTRRLMTTMDRATPGCAPPSSPAAWRWAIIPAKASCARSLRNGWVAFLFRWFG